MKKILSFVLAAVALVFTACSNDETIETSGNGQNNKGMVLVATVSQQGSRATMNVDDTFGTWNFAFSDNDNVVVGNNTINNYYTFTKKGDTFSSTDAKVTATNADWYAYYPATTIDLTNQEGTSESAAKLYALAGKTEKATTGAEGLTINMKAQAAVLRIVKVDNYGPCDIFLKTKEGKYVSGLKAKKDEAGFDVVKSDTKVSVFKVANENTAGIYYVIVPAGVYLEVWNEDRKFKTTSKGLNPGKYYTLTSGPTSGTAIATINGKTEKIDWVQMWIGGPRIAVKNASDKMDLENARKTGDDYIWGKNWQTPSLDEVKDMYDQSTLLNNDILESNYEYKNNRYGFTLKGKQPGYNNNTCFLCGDEKSTEERGDGKFWVIDEIEKGYGTSMLFMGAEKYLYISHVTKDSPTTLAEVRPVLTIKTVKWNEQNIQ